MIISYLIPSSGGGDNFPVDCTVMRHYRRVTDSDGCVSMDTLPTNNCRGGCGRIAGKCCVPDDYVYKVEPFKCPDGSFKFLQVGGVNLNEDVVKKLNEDIVKKLNEDIV